MSEFRDDFVIDRDDDSPLMKDLRKQLREALKREAEALKENTLLKTEKRSTTVADVLKAKGANPKVAKFIDESVEPTEAAVTAWLTEWADVFNIKVPDAGEAEAENGDGGIQVSPEERAAFERARNTEAAGSAVPNLGADQTRQTLASLKGKGSDDAIAALRLKGLVS